MLLHSNYLPSLCATLLPIELHPALPALRLSIFCSKTNAHDAIFELDWPREPQLACSETLHLKFRLAPAPTYQPNSWLSLLAYDVFIDQLAVLNNQEPPGSHNEAFIDLALVLVSNDALTLVD